MPKTGKLVVLATGDLAIPVLEALAAEGHEILRIVSRSPRPEEDRFLPEESQGSAVALWAKRAGIDQGRSSQPGSDRVRETLTALAPDLGVVVSFGRRFPTALLDVPKRGWVKIHFSLLPKYRGLHAVRAALWNGDRQTGATAIQVTDEPDAGPILEHDNLPIGPHEIFGELAPRVAEVGAQVAVTAIARVLRSKSPKTRKQNEKAASASPVFGRRHLIAPWWRSADRVYNRLRSLSPDPGMTTLMNGARVRILKGRPANYLDSPIGETGSYLGLRSGRIAVLCGNGTVFAISRVQRQGDDPVSASIFARKKRLQVGDVLV